MIKKRYLPHKLYAILDYSYIGKSQFYNVANNYLLSGIKLIEVKILNKEKEFMVEIIKKILELKDIYEFSLILYENIEIVKELNLDGIHLDQSSVTIKAAKNYIEDLIVAKACYSYKEAEIAYREGADFIVMGPLFYSSSEKYMGHYNYISIEELANTVKDFDIPVVAFGGINLSNIISIIETRVDAVTVVSNIFQDASPMEKISSVLALFDGKYNKKSICTLSMSNYVTNRLTSFIDNKFKDIFLNDILDVKKLPKVYNNKYDLLFYCIAKENLDDIIPLEEISRKFNIARSKIVILTNIDSHFFRTIVKDYKSLALLYIEDEAQLNILRLIVESVIKK